MFEEAEEHFSQAISIRDQLQRRDYLDPEYNLGLTKWKQGLADEARDQFAEISGTADEILARHRHAG